LAERLEQEQRRIYRSDKEANQRALLTARLEQDQRRKARSDMEAKQRALLTSNPTPVVQATPSVSWKERMISEVKMRDVIGVSLTRDVLASKNVVTSSSTQNESTVAADPMETKGFDAVELSKEESLISNLFVTPSNPAPVVQATPSVAWKDNLMSKLFATPSNPAPVVQAEPSVSWKERMISETNMRDVIGVSLTRDVLASKNVVTSSSTQNESTVAADPMETKGFDAVELITEQSLISNMFATPSDPAVSWKERMISEAEARDGKGVSSTRDAVASKNVVTSSSTQNESTVAADPMGTKGFDTVELTKGQALMSELFVTPSDPAPVVQVKPSLSWKERMIAEAKLRDTIGVSRTRDVVASKNLVIWYP
jgi:hypothetical protein